MNNSVICNQNNDNKCIDNGEKINPSMSSIRKSRFNDYYVTNDKNVHMNPTYLSYLGK